MGGILENVKVDLPAKEFYENAAQPFVKSTGEIVGLVPRTIHASLAKLETWVLKREYAVKQIEKELKAKLEKYPPEEICEPDMAVAGPAIEAASWRSNSEIIREMYVNLPAKSMLVHEKENAHPAFVEIIKQLSPDEAKIIKQMVEVEDRYSFPVLKVTFQTFQLRQFPVRGRSCSPVGSRQRRGLSRSPSPPDGKAPRRTHTPAKPHDTRLYLPLLRDMRANNSDVPILRLGVSKRRCAVRLFKFLRLSSLE